MRIGWPRAACLLPVVGLLLLVCPAFHTATLGQDHAVPTQVVGALYAPIEAELLAEYNRDHANKKVQTWRQYWDWVQTFYKGNILSAGWNDFCKATLDVVKSEKNHPKVLARLNALGKIISQEWAKDSSVGKITTADLRRWNEAIVAARRDDGGSGEHLLSVIETIGEKAKRLKGR